MEPTLYFKYMNFLIKYDEDSNQWLIPELSYVGPSANACRSYIFANLANSRETIVTHHRDKEIMYRESKRDWFCPDLNVRGQSLKECRKMIDDALREFM